MLAGAVVLLVAAGSVAAWSLAANQGEADDLLPNLAQAVPDELSGRTGGTLEEPTFFLGFKSAAANLGDGPLVVLGSRRGIGQDEMTLRQRIERTDGSQRTVPLRATLRYVRSSDHSHWHVLGFMRYELRNADGVRLVRDRKTGFCLGDRYRVEQSLPGRAPSARYSDRCGKGAPRLLRIREGISVGWGDDYSPHLEGQELDLTELPGGRIHDRAPRQREPRPAGERLLGQRILARARPALAERTEGAAADRRRRPLPTASNVSVRRALNQLPGLDSNQQPFG